MKTKSILKIAVVAMAALGAYAFNGNVSSQKSTFIYDGNQCMNIGYACDYDGLNDCLIATKKGVTPAWDTDCELSAKHSSSTPIVRDDLDF